MPPLTQILVGNANTNIPLGAFLQERRDHFSFDQSDSRSLEFLYCSNLLLT